MGQQRLQALHRGLGAGGGLGQQRLGGLVQLSPQQEGQRQHVQLVAARLLFAQPEQPGQRVQQRTVGGVLPAQGQDLQRGAALHRGDVAPGGGARAGEQGSLELEHPQPRP